MFNMKNILVLVLLLSIIINLNAQKVHRCPVGYIHSKCENKPNLMITTKENKFCVMKRVSRCAKRQRCCIQTKRCKLKKCKVLKKRCSWNGKAIKAKCLKETCKFQKFGECHKRKRCCVGNKCTWRGKKLRTGKCKNERVCASRRVGKCHLRKRCCNKNGKHCAWVGKPYKTGGCNSICTMRRIGKCLLKKRCCNNGRCKFYGKSITLRGCNKKCSIVRFKCFAQKRCCFGNKCKYVGKKIKKKCRKEVCRITSFSKCLNRKLCCNKKGKHCRWVGKTIPKKCMLKKQCKWVRRGKCSKRRVCCNISPCCGSQKRKCRWEGKAVKTDCVKEKCFLRKIGKCSYIKTCCKKNGKSCRNSGKKVTFGCKRVCSLRKFNKCHLRRYCCNSKGLKCKWSGKLVKRVICQNAKCQYRTVGNCKRRKYCCFRNKCSWRGKIIPRKNCKEPEDCRLIKTRTCYERKRCCVGKRCRWAGEEVKIDGCGPKNHVCILYADPHAISLKGTRFEAQTVGDWVLYKGRNLQVHYRGKKWPNANWVAMVKVGVRVDGNRLTTRDLTLNHWNLNGRNVNVNTINLGKTTIKKNGNTVIIDTHRGEKLELVTSGSYFNSYVTSNLARSTGICSQQFIKSKYFRNRQDGDIVVITKHNCPKKKRFTRHCQKLRLSGFRLKNCIRDLCNGFLIDKEDGVIKQINIISTKCRYVKTKKCLMRKKCCLRRGKGRKNHCKFVGGAVRVKNCHGVCRIKRLTKCTQRKYCCKGRRCKFVGKMIKDADCPFLFKKQICSLKTVGKCQVRKWCCKVNKRTKKSKCKFVGLAQKDKRCGKKVCRFMNVGPCLERKHCCKNGRCFWEGAQRKIWNCNPQPARMVQCYSYADPHMVGFNNNRFEAQQPGSFNLYSGRKLFVNYNAVKTGAWAAIVSASVSLNGAHFNFGVHFNQPFGKRLINGNAYITRNGNKITCSSGEGEEVDIVSNGSYLDLYVRTNKKNIGGLCVTGSQAASPVKNTVCRNRNANVIWCRRNGGKGHRGFQRNCVFDLCQGLSRKQEKRIKREVRFQKRRKIHINKFWWNHRKFKKARRIRKRRGLFNRIMFGKLRKIRRLIKKRFIKRRIAHRRVHRHIHHHRHIPRIVRRFATPRFVHRHVHRHVHRAPVHRVWRPAPVVRHWAPAPVVRHWAPAPVVRHWSPPPRRSWSPPPRRR